MNRSLVTATLAAALGLAGVAATQPVRAAMDPKAATMEKMTKEHLEKCYGVAAKARNDCAAGVHSCAGQSTMDRDPASFVLLPKGDCGKIAGGTMAAM